MDSFHFGIKHFKKLSERHEQDERESEITCTVKQVERDARNPARRRVAEAADYDIDGHTQRAEKQPVSARNHSPEHGIFDFSESHRGKSEDCPDVEVIDIPNSYSENEDFKRNINVHGIEALFSENDRINHCEKRHRLDVWKSAKREFKRESDAAEDAEKRDFTEQKLVITLQECIPA